MSDILSSDYTVRVGQIAGTVWHQLNESGPQSISAIIRNVEAPRDMVLQGVGWLAREGKLHVTETTRGRLIGLNPEDVSRAA